jgi:CheY-like chemotaxis protein
MNSRNPIILCVDDEKANLDLLESILVYSDYKVVDALNGIDALFYDKTAADACLRLFREKGFQLEGA